jgi:hypothetical protein
MTRLTGQGIVGTLLAKGKSEKPRLFGDEKHLGGKGATEYLMAEALGKHMMGKGTGSFLLDGGMGGQSSYTSPANYTATTGRVIRKGGGLEKLSSKLGNLNIKEKKHNIKFEM